MQRLNVDSNQNVEKTNDFRYNNSKLNKKKRRGRKSRSERENTFEDVISYVEEKRQALMENAFYQELEENIKIKILPPNRPTLVDIVCYGIGSIEKSYRSQYQFALLLILKNLLKITSKIYVYDPVLTEVDIEVLTYFNVELIKTNEKAKRTISNQTLFYMPHCPLGLYDNLISANWERKKLENIIIFGNRLEFYGESMTKTTFNRKAPYISQISLSKLFGCSHFQHVYVSLTILLLYALKILKSFPFPSNITTVTDNIFNDLSWQWFRMGNEDDEDFEFWCEIQKVGEDDLEDDLEII
ncbi:157_t:CDS:2 [Acaulospora morrowiae]|uniref:157_t:CDS:1 n=1 Tax=Acaulospora morrowiae TaxID=94023 RepID=A0A9N8VHB0_9GLOM|nr:157_t:CDS:2 [Acaulospora morrowiae]